MARTELREKAGRIARVLDRLLPAAPVPLAHEDPFQLLVAVVLSAQCTDARVNLVTPGLFAIAPDAQALAALPLPRILQCIRSCGLAPTKARNLKALFPEASWGKLHLQIIYFGREHCPALRHDLRGCPICAWAAPKRTRPRTRPRSARAKR